MNFTNSPYERMMKEIPHYKRSAPQKAPEGSPCAGCPYWQGITCVFCYRKHLKSSANNVSIWPRMELNLQGSLSTVLAEAI